MTEPIVYKFKVETEYPRLDSFVKEYLDLLGQDLSRAYITKLIKKGDITLNNKQVKPSKNIKLNDEISIKLTLKDEEPISLKPKDIPIKIVYEDDYIIVINKQANLVVHPGPGHLDDTLANAILFHTQGHSSDLDPQRPGIVHRLDKDTSGLIVVAKNNFVHLDLARQFMDKTARRVYFAVSQGVPKEKSGVFDTLFARNFKDRKKWTSRTKEGKRAITNYFLLSKRSKYSLLMLKLKTGRTHQIRVHLTENSLPILGDQTYGNAKHKYITRQALHAVSLSLIHPIYKIRQTFYSPLEQDMKDLITDLGL